MKILIIEDDLDISELMGIAVRNVIKEPREIRFAKSFLEAEELINSGYFDLAFVDQNIPRNQSYLIPEGIGYSLIPKILSKNPKTKIVGTSSMPPKEIIPQYTLGKNYGSIVKGLGSILEA